MGKIVHLLLISVLLQLPFIPSLHADLPPTNPSRHILEIHSYNPGLSWTHSIIKGLRDAFEKSDFQIHVEAEFLDARRFADAESGERIREQIRWKLRGVAPDAVIVSDNAAFEFVLDQRDRFFPDAP